MYMDQEKHCPQEELYRIGTVSALTGLSVERLRAWERRYNLSPAHKSGRTRFYDQSQLDRFRIIKRLIDLGHPISSLVELDQKQLETRLKHQTLDEPEFRHSNLALDKPMVGLIGPNLLLLEQKASGTSEALQQNSIEIAARWANIEAFKSEQEQIEDLDVIVIQLPVLNIQPIELIREYFPKSKLIVLYQFTRADIISQIQSLKIPTIKWPISWIEIEHMCVNDHRLLRGNKHPSPRKFSDEELIAIASSSDDATGCPEYVVESIHQLNALATYSHECSKESKDSSSMEALHASTTHARAELEIALDRLISADLPKKSLKRANKH